MTDIYNEYRDHVLAALDSLVATDKIPAGLATERVGVDPPRDASHGDLATNVAMVLAKQAGMKPRDLALELVPLLKENPEVADVEIAGPGFINITLSDCAWLTRLAHILKAGPAYGRASIGQGRPVNVEYVSANPTGPLHAAHARGAVVGDALAALLEFAGFDVVREYYINDAGNQVEILARSAHLRYREALGEQIGIIPEGYYPGDYLKAVGVAIAERDGDRWLYLPEEQWLEPFRQSAVELMMNEIREDLEALGVHQSIFTSERDLVASGGVDTVVAELERRGLLYVGVLEPPKGKKPDDWEPRAQTLFRATAFGDDVDRPMRKSDGSWTYFANDIAYHFDKFRRCGPTLIDVWGADHGGYVKRMQAAVSAITDGAGVLDVKICQIVHMLDGGKPVRMSKRAGTFVTLRDVIEEIGRDVLRFIMLTRRNDQTLEFDFQKVTEQSRDNPVFYVQYAYARISSVFRRLGESFPSLAEEKPECLAERGLESLRDPDELALIKLLCQWPRQVIAAAEAHEPHRIAFYLQEVAAAFHGLWNKGMDREHIQLRFIDPNDEGHTAARAALLRAVATVLTSGFGVMGVAPREVM